MANSGAGEKVVKKEIPEIIAIGGGGFSDGRDPALDEYVLARSRSSRPRIGFIGTASGDADSYLAKFYAAFSKHECRPSHLPLFRRTPDLAEALGALDIVYVGGGNTRSMLAVWREWNLGDHLAQAAGRGTVLAGISAGAICWFDAGITDASAESLGVLPCLGWLAGSCCPHYDGEAERRPTYQRLVASGEALPGVAIDDGVAVHYVGGKAHRVVAARRGAGAYDVAAVNGVAVESSLAVEYLEL